MKMVKIEDDVWEKLAIRKIQEKKKNINDVIKELL